LVQAYISKQQFASLVNQPTEHLVIAHCEWMVRVISFQPVRATGI